MAQQEEDGVGGVKQQQLPKLRLAIVGCGQIVVHHVAALTVTKEFEVVALCDPSAERRRIIRHECRTIIIPSNDVLNTNDHVQEFDSLDELLAASLTSKVLEDAVLFISVPHDLHHALASQALEAGRRVVMEKPLAPTLNECHSLLQQAKKGGGMLIVSEQSPYWQEIVKAKQLLEEGAIGTLVSAASYYYESMRDNVTSGIDPTTGGLGWRTSLKRCGGGVVIDGGLHWLRPLRELCGDMEQVVGVTRRHIQPGLQLEGESLAHALLKIKSPPPSSSSSLNETDTEDEPLFDYRRQPEGSGALVVTFSANMMHTAPMAHDSCPYFRLTGTKGELVVAGTGLNPNGGGGLKLYNQDETNENDGAAGVDGIDLLSVEDRQGGFFVGFQGIWRVAGDILRRNDQDAAVKTVRDAAADVAVALALYKSSESHQWEPCELFDDIPIPNP
eukprot:scaffold114580_cov45-Attheya_sp.AAC.3